MANSPWSNLLAPNGKPLFSGSVGASPFNAGTASGMMPDFSGTQSWLQGTVPSIWSAGHKMPFSAPTLSRLNATPATLLARRRLAGSQGVGSTFLTGAGGVKPGSQTLGYSGLLGQ